jgi:hypothetical protein
MIFKLGFEVSIGGSQVNGDREKGILKYVQGDIQRSRKTSESHRESCVRTDGDRAS